MAEINLPTASKQDSILNSVGTSADLANENGSIHAKLKDIKNSTSNSKGEFDGVQNFVDIQSTYAEKVLTSTLPQVPILVKETLVEGPGILLNLTPTLTYFGTNGIGVTIGALTSFRLLADGVVIFDSKPQSEYSLNISSGSVARSFTLTRDSNPTSYDNLLTNRTILSNNPTTKFLPFSVNFNERLELEYYIHSKASGVRAVPSVRAYLGLRG